MFALSPQSVQSREPGAGGISVNRYRQTAALAAASALALLASPAAAEDYLQVGLGVDYSSGDYGETSDTEILAVPLSVKYNRGDFFLRASLPYVHVKGPGSVVPGDGGAVPGGAAGAVTSNSGVGDFSLSAGYTLPLTGSTFLDVIGRVKLPTASEAKGLGTGTTDFTAEAALTHQLGPVSLSGRGGRRFNGSSARFPLDDIWFAGAGAYYQAGDVTLGLDYDWRERSLPTAANRSELTGSVSVKLSQQLRLQGYGYTGFTDGSPDAGGGLQVLYRFGL